MENSAKAQSPLMDLLAESMDKIVKQVQSRPFRSLGYAYAAGLMLATPPGRALALKFLTRKETLGLF